MADDASVVNQQQESNNEDVDWRTDLLTYAGIDSELIPGVAQKLIEANIDECLLDELDAGWLEKMGISAGHSIKLLNYIPWYVEAQQLQEENTDTVGDYFVLEFLGQGTHHDVMTGRHIKTGNEVALKILRKGDWKPTTEDSTWMDNITLHEQTMLELVSNHPSIMTMYSSYQNVWYRSTKGDYQTHVLVLELSLTSLLDFLAVQAPFSEPQACYIFQQLVLGIEYCHSKGVAHRDLKPEQILFTNTLDCRISDFNFSCKVTDLVSDMAPALAGTLRHMSPEIHALWMEHTGPDARSLNEQEMKVFTNPYPADIWGLGVILFFLLTGIDPFKREEDTVQGELRPKEKKCARYEKLKAQEWDSFWRMQEDLADRDMQKRNIKRRPNSVKLSPQARDLLQLLFEPDPNLRIGIAEIKQHPWFNQALPSKEDVVTELKERYLTAAYDEEDIGAAPEDQQHIDPSQPITPPETPPKIHPAATQEAASEPLPSQVTTNTTTVKSSKPAPEPTQSEPEPIPTPAVAPASNTTQPSTSTAVIKAPASTGWGGWYFVGASIVLLGLGGYFYTKSQKSSEAVNSKRS